MNAITKFFHELINPHCSHCLELQEIEREEKNHCNTCEVLSMQLAVANKRIDDLISKISQSESNEVKTVEDKPRQVIQTQRLPWSVIKNSLETKSKIKAAEIKAEQAASTKAATPDVTEKLEQDLGITNAGSSN
jgi:hypothetical protein